jgi:hypothetical protein
MGEYTAEPRKYLPRIGHIGRACLVEATLAGGSITAVEARKRIERKNGQALDGSIHKALTNTNIFEVSEVGPPKVYTITAYGALILGETIANLEPDVDISVRRAFISNTQRNDIG